MASRQECEKALRALAARLDDHAEQHGRPSTPERILSCRLTDLNTSFSAELRDGALTAIVEETRAEAQIVLTLTSDDLIAISDGSMPIATAWANGRIKIAASLMDMLRVRTLL